MRFLFVMMCIIFGLVGIISPETSWKIEHGWQFKDAEPSDLALTANRIGGVICIICAGILIFIETAR